MAIALAVNTALTCHFPNYTRNHALRTRITLVDKDMDARKNDLIHRYQALFDNSWYRFIDLSKTSGSGVTFLHRPDYCGTREDFVDVEWEFVTGSLSDGRLYEKLKKWSSSERQLLTLALCDELLGEHGAFRVHGGGFAGTVQAFVPLELLPAFRAGIEAVLGKGRCYVLNIRPVGGTLVAARDSE